jgi:TonB family protein
MVPRRLAPAKEDKGMFDKLIVSEPEGADLKSRRNYFLVSSLVVGLLFLTAVVFSIFAADYNIGSDGFEMAELIAPVVAIPQTEPEPPRQAAPANPSSSTLPTRQVNMPSLKENPIVPIGVSVVANNQQARPNGRFGIAPVDANPGPAVGSGRDTSTVDGPALTASVPQQIEREPAPEPPPVRESPRPPAAPKSLGVINGMAISLPKPNYPAAAQAVNVQGKVDVQVLIDETGRVISAKAVSGNGMLKSAAEQAARNARFSPTYLSKVPVKVTGVIVYNFSRG